MPPFHEIEKIVSDYSVLKQHLNSNSTIIQEFPKMLLMSIVSLYERSLKLQLSRIVFDISSGTLTTLPQILALSANQQTSDFLYGKFYTYNKHLHMEDLNAQAFYNMFNGSIFENLVRSNFNHKRTTILNDMENEINKLFELANSNARYEDEWIVKVDEKDTLTALTFEEAEISFLSLKLRRNRLAHDYINGLSDTFEDINLFYTKSRIYVSAVVDCLAAIV